MTSSSSPKDPSESAFRQRLSVCITLPLISMVLLAGTMTWQVQRLRGATDRRKAFENVLSSAGRLGRLATDLETGVHGYLITGSRYFLEPYSRARPRIEGAITRLQASVADLPSQSQKAEKLRGSLDAWNEHARRALELRARMLSPTAKAPGIPPFATAAIAEERRRMEPVRALLASIIRSEENSEAQEARDEGLRDRLALSLGIGLAFGLGLLMALVFGNQVKGIWQSLQDELRKARGVTADREAALRELQQELERTRSEAEFFRHLVQEASSYALFKVALDGSIQSWNHGAERIHGFGRAEALGQGFSVLFGPKAVEAGNPAHILEIATRKGRFSEEGWRARKDGSLFWAEMILNAVHDDFGEMDGFSVLIRDLTARKRADTEQAILFSKVEEAIHARDQFLSIASHEIKVPALALNRQIQGLLLQQAQGSSTLRPVLEGFRRQTDRLQRMADEMVDLARSHSGSFAYDFQPTPLGDLIRDVMDRMADQAAASGCRMELEGSTHAQGHWDGPRIERILTHLLSNAFRHGPGKPVTITVALESSHVEIRIHDRGPGIDGERIERIFERFSSRTPQSSPNGESGLGLGLYLSRQIAEGHGGRLWAENSPSSGAVFHLELPLRESGGDATGLTTAGIRNAAVIPEELHGAT